MRGTSAPAVAYLVGAAWSIALAAVALRRALELGADPASAVVPRLTVPASVLVAVAVFHPRLRRAVRALKTRTLLVCGGWGVMILLVTLGELEAISRVQVAIVVLFFGLAPLWVALASRILFGTHLTRRFALASATAVTGVGLIVGPPSARPDLFGAAIALTAGLLGALGLLVVERGMHDTSPASAATVALATAALLGLAARPGAIVSQLSPVDTRTTLIVAAGLLTGVAVVLQFAGIGRAGALVAGVAVTLEPVATALLAWFLLGDSLTPGQVTGGVIALVGVVLALREPRAFATGSSAATGALSRPRRADR